MNSSRYFDPAERSAFMRLFYHNWRPTRLGWWVNRFACGGPALGYRLGSRPPWKSEVAHPAADAQIPWL